MNKRQKKKIAKQHILYYMKDKYDLTDKQAKAKYAKEHAYKSNQTIINIGHHYVVSKKYVDRLIKKGEKFTRRAQQSLNKMYKYIEQKQSN